MNWNDVFEYRDGEIYWKCKVSAKTVIGRIAGTITKHGYKKVQVNKKPQYNHRVIWEMHHGKVPEAMEIDHIDGDRSNNLIGNLRCVSRRDNCKNKRLLEKNTSGMHGVRFDEVKGKWVVRIGFGGRNLFFGYFDSKDEAIKQRIKQNEHLGFHENHGFKL